MKLGDFSVGRLFLILFLLVAVIVPFVISSSLENQVSSKVSSRVLDMAVDNGDTLNEIGNETQNQTNQTLLPDLIISDILFKNSSSDIYVNSSLLNFGNYSVKFEVFNLGSVLQNITGASYSITKNSVPIGDFLCQFNGTFFILPNTPAFCTSSIYNFEIDENELFSEFEIDSLNQIDEENESNNKFTLFFNITEPVINNTNNTNQTAPEAFIYMNYTFINLTRINIDLIANYFGIGFMFINIFEKTPLNQTWTPLMFANTTCVNESLCVFSFTYDMIEGYGEYEIKANAANNSFQSNYSFLNFSLELGNFTNTTNSTNSTVGENNTKGDDPNPNNGYSYNSNSNLDNDDSEEEEKSNSSTIIFNNFIDESYFEKKNSKIDDDRELYLSKTRYTHFVERFSGLLDIEGVQTDYSLLVTTKEEYAYKDNESVPVKSISKAYLRTDEELYVFFIDELSQDIIKGHSFMDEDIEFSRDNSALTLTEGLEVFS